MEHHWKFSDTEQARKITIEGFDFIVFEAGDKQTVREHIVSCMSRSTHIKVIKQYERCITTIARMDYPERWPSLLQEVAAYLGSQEERNVHTGLIALKCLVKKYEYEMDDERKPLYDIIQQTFGMLGNLIN